MAKKKNEFGWWPNWEGPLGSAPKAWPDEVPTLAPENMRTRTLGTGDCRGLLGWAGGFPYGDIRTKVEDVIRTVVADTSGRDLDIVDYTAQ